MRIFFRLPDLGDPVATADEMRERWQLLARNLEALASPTRLELLHALRTPRSLHQIRVGPSESRGGTRPGRALSRQAVTRHLGQLQEAGLVSRNPAEGPGQGDTFVLNHERLFAMVDEMRGLSKLRPILQAPAAAGATLARGHAEVALPAGPRLLLAYGRDDGVAFGLDGGPGTRWKLGRAAGSEVLLDYDPYVSSHHATVTREAGGAPGGFVLRDERSRNGTWVNWRQLPRGGSAALGPGDLVAIGRSLLVFQP